MGKTTFSGPIRTGKAGDGTAGSATLGHVLATQKFTVSGETSTTVARMPNGSADLVDITVVATGDWNATAGASTDFLLGDGTTDNLYGVIPLSARGVYKMAAGHANASAMATAVSNWAGITGVIVAETTSAVTAAASGVATVYVTYYQNSATSL